MITFADLPERFICDKLKKVAFNTPEKNLAVFKFANSIKDYQQYYAEETDKLTMQYGEEDTNNPGLYNISMENLEVYKEKLNELSQSVINEKIFPLDLTFSDFEEKNCSYPRKKNFWLSAEDIEILINFCEKIKGDK